MSAQLNLSRYAALVLTHDTFAIAGSRHMAEAIRFLIRPATAPYLGPIAKGLLIALTGAGAWTALARMNASLRPDLPWAAGAMALLLLMLVGWLNGAGPPAASAASRRALLRLWPPQPHFVRDAGGLPAVMYIVLLAALTAVWISIGRLTPVPDLSGYPTSVYRWSMFVMSPVVAGVVEEAAFRGYMQRGLERVDSGSAIWITSLIFVAAHITHGLDAILLLGPGMFAASMLYGHLARRTGTILPGMCIHVLGDLTYTYFGVLNGNGRLLFVQ